MRARRRGWWLPAALMMTAVTGCGVHAAAGPAWVAASATGPRVWFESLQMISARVGWAVASDSAADPDAGRGAPLLAARTTDGGRTWAIVGPPALATVVGEPIVLDAVTASRVWLAAVVPTGKGRPATEVFGTTDGGASWIRSAPVRLGEPVSISFADPAHGWLLESLGAAMGEDWVAVYRTTDGGLRWSLTARTVASNQFGTTSKSGLPTACDKSGLSFESVRTGWITGDCTVGSEVLVTSDAGYHWAPQRLPITAATCSAGCFIGPPQFAGPTDVLTIGHYGTTGNLLVSDNGGHTWQLRALPAGAGPYPQIRFFGAGRGILVPGGAQETIGRTFYVTADDGWQWTAVPQGLRFAGSTSVDFVSERDGFAWFALGNFVSGPAPDIYVTTDSGRTWTAIAPRAA